MVEQSVVCGTRATGSGREVAGKRMHGTPRLLAGRRTRPRPDSSVCPPATCRPRAAAEPSTRAACLCSRIAPPLAAWRRSLARVSRRGGCLNPGLLTVAPCQWSILKCWLGPRLAVLSVVGVNISCRSR